MKNNEERKVVEKNFHDDYFSNPADYRKNQRIFNPKWIKTAEHDYIFDYFGDMRGGKVLVYGVGNQVSLVKECIRRGASVFAIDISSVAVDDMNARLPDYLPEDYRERYIVREMDCENLDFEPGTFDFAFGRGIIHHLDILKGLGQVKKVLKDGGRFGFIEPLATNPLIQLYRYLTPEARTPDEHPLTTRDIDMFRDMFDEIHCKYQQVLTLLSFPLRKLTDNDKLFVRAFGLLRSLDDILLHIPGYRLLCWTVIVTGSK